MADLHTVSAGKTTARVSETSMVKSIRTRTAKPEATQGSDKLSANNGSDGELDTISEQSDNSGNTVFVLCIVAFLLTALGLGLFLWRKYRQSQAIGQNGNGPNSEETTESKGAGLAGMFRRQKNRPSPLPLSSIRNPNDPALPPYSPFAAAAGQSPWMGGNFTMQTAQAAQTGAQVEADNDTSDAKSVRSLTSISKARRDAAERAGNPFSPFAPFSPVSTTHDHQADHKARISNDDGEEESEDEEAIRAPKKRNGLHPSSALQNSITMPRPAPVRYMDPEAAQAMGIHPEVIKTAEPGISEDEIERRRARAQRRLDERQRAEEGSVVEDGMEASHFSQIASDRRI